MVDTLTTEFDELNLSGDKSIRKNLDPTGFHF